MGVLNSISSYRKGPVLGYKILLKSSSPEELDRFWDSLMYIQMQTGVLYYDTNKSFTEYLRQNYEVAYAHYNWVDKTASMTYCGDDKLEVGYKIECTDLGTAYIIDFNPVWYLINREKKWYERNVVCGKKVYL